MRRARPAHDRVHHRALPAADDVLLHARADRDRRHSVHRQPREAHPRRRPIYYRRVAEHFRLDVRPGEDVVDVRREAGRRLHARGRRAPTTPSAIARPTWSSRPATTTTPTSWTSRARTCPTSPTTSSRGIRYWHRRVVVIGAGNSSVDAALECWRAGATVTLVHFGEGFDRTVKAWVLPDITNRVKEGSIAVRWRSRVRADHADRGRARLGRDRRGRAAAVRRRAGHDRLPRRHDAAPAAGRAGRRGDRRPGARRAHDGHAGRRASTWPASSPAATTPTGCSSRMPAATAS